VLTYNNKWITSNGVKYEVFGSYHGDEIKWYCKEAEFMSYFKQSNAQPEVLWCDHAAKMAAEQKEADKKAKKDAKKQKQKEAAATMQGNPYGMLEQDEHDSNSAEGKTDAQRAREKAKRKAQQARKKEKQYYLLTTDTKTSRSGTDAVPRVFSNAGEFSDTETMRPDDDNGSDSSDGHADLEVVGSKTKVVHMGENATAADYVLAASMAAGGTVIMW